MTSRSTINVTFSPALPAGLDALIVGVAESGEILVPAGAVSDGLAEAVARARRAAPGFKSAPEQLLDIMGHAESDVARIFAAGFGGPAAATPALVRSIGGRLAAHVQAEQLRRIGIAIDLPDQTLAAFLEGFALRAYAFTRYRTGPAAELADPIELVLVGGRGEAVVQGFRERRQPAVAGTHLARDLATEPANVLTPQSFAEAAQAVAQASGMMVEVLSDPELAAAGLEAFLAVGKGSPAGCRLAIVSWNGLPPVAGPTPAPVVLVGKGVTFDAGGITLKTGPGLEHNKWDMAGAAVVLGAMQSLAQRRAEVHAVGLMALAENMPSGVAMKPGDCSAA